MASQQTAESSKMVAKKKSGGGGSRGGKRPLLRSSSLSQWFGMLLLVACASLGAAPADARVESRAITLWSDGGSITAFDMFGFRAGGTAQFAVNFKRRGTRGSDVLLAYLVGCQVGGAVHAESI
jgi:hypothetical protein